VNTYTLGINRHQPCLISRSWAKRKFGPTQVEPVELRGTKHRTLNRDTPNERTKTKDIPLHTDKNIQTSLKQNIKVQNLFQPPQNAAISFSTLPNMAVVGVLALQGSFNEHIAGTFIFPFFLLCFFHLNFSVSLLIHLFNNPFVFYGSS